MTPVLVIALVLTLIPWTQTESGTWERCRWDIVSCVIAICITAIELYYNGLTFLSFIYGSSAVIDGFRIDNYLRKRGTK